MNKPQHPTRRHMNRKAACVTLDPWILARIDARCANRSEEINRLLARILLIEEGRGDMEPEERRRFKALALMGEISEDHQEKIDAQEAAIKRETPRRTAAPKPLSPWPT